MKDTVLVLAILGDPTIPPGLPSSGGFNKTLNNLLTNLKNSNFDIIVITDTNGLDNRKNFENFSNNISLYRITTLQEEVLNQDNLYNATDRMYDDIKRIIANCGAHIKLIHTFYWISGYLGKILSDELKAPFVHTVISLFIYRKLANRNSRSEIQFTCENAFLPFAKFVLAITEDEKRLLRRYYNISENKIFVTGRNVSEVFYSPARDINDNPLGLEDKKYFPVYKGKSERYGEWWKQQAFIYLGRIVEIKGVDKIVNAWVKNYKTFKGKVPSLWIIGGGLDEISKMRKACGNIQKYEREGKLIWWGYLDAPSVSALFMKACTLIVHSLYEPGGRVVLEAFCQGIPVISTPCGFGKDYIYDGYNGHTVNYGDENGLCRCLAYYSNNPYLSNVLGNNAKRYYLQLVKHWDYYGFHKKLYENFLNNTQRPIVAKDKLLPDNLDDISAFEKLTQFPYTHFNITTEQILRDIQKAKPDLFLNPITEINKCKNGQISFMCGKKTYLIRTFCNKLTPESLWNTFVSEKGIIAPKRMRRIAQCSDFRGIIKPLYISIENSYYLTDKENENNSLSLTHGLEMLKKFAYGKTEALEKSFFSIFGNVKIKYSLKKVIANYRKQFNLPFIPPFSLKVYLEVLLYHFKFYKVDIISDMQINNLYKLICLSEDINPIGLNYNDSLYTNTAKFADEVCMLPNDSWYIGQIGKDIVEFIMESENPDYLLNHNEPILNVPISRLLMWQSVMLLRKILIDIWNRRLPDDKDLSLLDKTLNHIFNMK